MGNNIEIPEGWEEIHREMGGWAHEEKWGTVNVRFPHPRLGFSELIVEFEPTFLPPKTKVGIILITLQEEEPNDQEA